MTRVTFDEVRSMGRAIERANPGIPKLAVRIAASLGVLQNFLGRDWMADHLGTEAHPFFAGWPVPPHGETRAIRRIWGLADMLLNLQQVEGFADPLKKLATDKVETGFAALEAAKLLFNSGTKFRFNDPTRKRKGAAYDIDAWTAGGLRVAIEAKSRLESTSVTPEKIGKSLERARRQLPKGGCGIIFLRVPRAWGGDGYLETPFAEAAEETLRQSDRLAGVCVFSDRLISHQGLEGSMLIAREFWSKKEKFAAAADWRLISPRIILPGGRWVSVATLIGQTPPIT